MSVYYRCSRADKTHLAVKILAASNKENGLSHVSVVARSAGRKTLFLLLGHLRLLVVVSALLRSHLRRKHAWSNAVDSDLDIVLGNLRRQHPVEVNRRRLARVVRKVVLRDLNMTRNTADVDDGARPAMLRLGGLFN